MLNSMTRNEARTEALERKRAKIWAEIQKLQAERERKCGQYEDFGNPEWMKLSDRIQKLLWELDSTVEAE